MPAAPAWQRNGAWGGPGGTRPGMGGAGAPSTNAAAAPPPSLRPIHEDSVSGPVIPPGVPSWSPAETGGTHGTHHGWGQDRPGGARVADDGVAGRGRPARGPVVRGAPP